LQYIVIERLAQGGREKVKDDGLNLSDWLQSLASFWGHLYVLFLLLAIITSRYLVHEILLWHNLSLYLHGFAYVVFLVIIAVPICA
jgi:hypothetical protein